MREVVWNMKKYIIICLLFLFMVNVNAESDLIPFFAQVIIDRKCDAEKTYFYIEIFIFQEKKEKKWYVNHITLDEDDLDKEIIISVEHSRYNDDYSLPLISDIKWEPGKSFECKYHYFHEPIHLKAIKKGKGEYDWEVYGNCRYKMRPDDPNDVERLFEIKSVKEIKLKYKKLRMVNLYYK